MYASRPKLPRLPMLKVDGILALVVVAFIPAIVNMPRRPNLGELDGTLLGYLILWTSLWITAIGFATLAAAVRYVWLESKRQVAFPGLGTAVGYLVLFTLSLTMR